MSKDRNCVLVVDDDLGMLTAIKQLLRAHDYEPILFSSAQAFKSHTDFEKAVCVILDINLNDGSGIELRHGLKATGLSSLTLCLLPCCETSPSRQKAKAPQREPGPRRGP
ncbi:response regulator [Bradyrhizobium sp. TZ2]